MKKCEDSVQKSQGKNRMQAYNDRNIWLNVFDKRIRERK